MCYTDPTLNAEKIPQSLCGLHLSTVSTRSYVRLPAAGHGGNAAWPGRWVHVGSRAAVVGSTVVVGVPRIPFRLARCSLPGAERSACPPLRK
jgi:hypothetical protein